MSLPVEICMFRQSQVIPRQNNFGFESYLKKAGDRYAPPHVK